MFKSYNVFTQFAAKKIQALQPEVRDRIIDKLQLLKNRENIFAVLNRLQNFAPATHRLRIGNYRLILELKEQRDGFIKFAVLDIGHRKDIYR